MSTIVMLFLLFPLSARTGEIEPSLRDKLANISHNELVPVVVRLNNRVDATLVLNAVTIELLRSSDFVFESGVTNIEPRTEFKRNLEESDETRRDSMFVTQEPYTGSNSGGVECAFTMNTNPLSTFTPKTTQA
jgi:hypothetical protein